MEQVTKPKQQQNNHFEITQGDILKHHGSGDQNVDKRVTKETKSYWKEAFVTFAVGILIALIVWYFRLNGLRPLYIFQPLNEPYQL